MRSPNEFWAAESRIERLRDLWESGIPTAKIAIELGCTKNAVIGMCQRLHLDQRGYRNGTSRPKTLFQRLDALNAEMDQVLRRSNVPRIPGSAAKPKSVTTTRPGPRITIHGKKWTSPLKHPK